jgi:hypothetical protein
MIALYDNLYAMNGPNTKIIPGHDPVASRDGVREYQAMLREVRKRVVKAVDTGMTQVGRLAPSGWARRSSSTFTAGTCLCDARWCAIRRISRLDNS